MDDFYGSLCANAPAVAGDVFVSEFDQIFASFLVGKFDDLRCGFTRSVWVEIQHTLLPDFAEDWCVTTNYRHTRALTLKQWQAEAFEAASSDEAASI